MTEMAICALTVCEGYLSSAIISRYTYIKDESPEEFGLILLSLMISLKALSVFLHISCRPAPSFQLPLNSIMK